MIANPPSAPLASTPGIDPLVRLSADNTGELKCVILTDDYDKACRQLSPYVSRIVKRFPFMGAFGAFVHVHKLEDLSKLPYVKAVTAHSTVYAHLSAARAEIGADTLHHSGLFARGVTTAVIDTGISPHLDFCMPRCRIRAFVDLVGGIESPYDDNGHGSAVASILMGNGLKTGGSCRGVAPMADVVMLKAMDHTGAGSAFHILEAMQWIYTHREAHNIRVVCMSFGTRPAEDDPLMLGAEVLWNSGITVVASAGNDGPENETITSPGASPRLITVGGAGFKAGTPYIPAFSSRGPYKNLIKPDLVAPAVNIRCCDANGGYQSVSGTSMSTPIAAGIAAHLCALHPSYTPDRIKEILLQSASPLPFPQEHCGHGLLNADAAIQSVQAGRR